MGHEELLTRLGKLITRRIEVLAFRAIEFADKATGMFRNLVAVFVCLTNKDASRRSEKGGGERRRKDIMIVAASLPKMEIKH